MVLPNQCFAALGTRISEGTSNMIVRKVTVSKGKKKQVYLEILDRKGDSGKDGEPLARLGPVELPVKSLGERCKEDFVPASEVSAERILTWGPGLVARHLWEELGIGEVVSAVCGDAVSRGTFALVANRLVDPEYSFGIGPWLERNYIPEGKRKAAKAAGSLDEEAL
jgi:hypothetical protein